MPSERGVVDVVYPQGLVQKRLDAVKHLSGSYGCGRGGGGGCGQGCEGLGSDRHNRGLPVSGCMFMSSVLCEEVEDLDV
jgi:hypothetical protein